MNVEQPGSLASEKGPAEVEAEVLMSRTAFDGAFLVVEGDNDSRFFRSRVDQARCEIVIAGGKPNVLGGLDRLNARAFRGALGVVDDDCDAVDGRHLQRPNLIPTRDARDLDALLIWSAALGRVLAEYADPGKLARVGNLAFVRKRLVELALPFGSLRRWSYIATAGLNFRSLSPYRFVTPEWSFDSMDLYAEAAAVLGRQTDDLVLEVDALSEIDSCLVCHGHDLVKILAIGMDRDGIIGSSKPSPETIASALRLGLDSDTWRGTELARDIVAWEDANPPFRILPL